MGQQDCLELARLAREAYERALAEEAFWLSMAAERGQTIVFAEFCEARAGRAPCE